MLTTVQIISTIVTTLVSLCSIFAAMKTTFNERKKYREERAAKAEEDKETDRCILRHDIKSMYNTFKCDKKWAESDYEDMEKMYNQYKRLGGNSFVDRIWTEVQGWEIDE